MAKQVTFNFIPDDKVFIIHGNKIKKGKVENVGCTVNNDGVKITYSIDTGCTRDIRKTQDLVFASKEDLIKSL